ncbi:LysM peptidoglycan-binding domain-containing protein, partial [Nonomuraea rhizosphaerae]|uniref:LysM peptidoglycan-binding domain-containing protein n=1 Tax=Nonomuraea rhizosphaerae TaxID=2665663 RepID=UPI003555F81F
MPTREPARPAGRPHGARQTPVRIPARRSAGDVLGGIGALLVLVGLVGGVPYGLLMSVGPPLSPELLDLDLLTSRVGPSTVIAVLVLFVWLAWLQFFLCVVVEVYAGVRRVGMPARVPLSGGSQALANKLVSAVLVLFTAGAMVVPIVKMAATPAPTVSQMAAVAYTAPIVEHVEVQRTKKVYVVQPPHGRHHESLWEIAEKCLGDGRRYPEIYRLNQHKEQPDGSRLRMADLIRPGWVLDMPDDARNTHTVPVNQARAQTLEQHPAGEHRGHRVAADDVRQHSTVKQGPAHERRGPDVQADSGARSEALDLVDYLAASSLAAAGLLAVLARRRREQLWRRMFGRRLVRPRDDAAKAEVALRLGADAPG